MLVRIVRGKIKKCRVPLAVFIKRRYTDSNLIIKGEVMPEVKATVKKTAGRKPAAAKSAVKKPAAKKTAAAKKPAAAKSAVKKPAAKKTAAGRKPAAARKTAVGKPVAAKTPVDNPEEPVPSSGFPFF
ncbi:MAG: hypothetical protein LBK77_03140 [Spirochaetaceae bacterium]|nr:hypothetical protein [Spirochaetaceae bacterium]